MHDNSKTKSSRSVDLKDAAALLLKGGSLVSEPCSKCEGVQIKLKEKMICVNCGNEQNHEQNTSNTASSTISSKHEEYPTIDKSVSSSSTNIQTGLGSAKSILQDKILMISREIKDEQDVVTQKQKANLIEIYLTILEKIEQLMIGQSNQ